MHIKFNCADSHYSAGPVYKDFSSVHVTGANNNTYSHESHNVVGVSMIYRSLLLSDYDVCLQHLSYASGDLMVDASFMQTLWNMNPVSSGCELVEGKLKNI